MKGRKLGINSKLIAGIQSINGHFFTFERMSKDGCYVCSIDNQSGLEIHFKEKDVKSIIYLDKIALKSKWLKPIKEDFGFNEKWEYGCDKINYELQLHLWKVSIKESAIKTKDGIVFTGFNHALALRELKKKTIVNSESIKDFVFGFVTNSGEFLDREEAGKRAFETYQIAHIDNHLISEFLYLDECTEICDEDDLMPKALQKVNDMHIMIELVNRRIPD